MLRIFNICVVKPDITVLNTLLPKVVLLLVSVICNTVLSCLSVPQEIQFPREMKQLEPACLNS